MAHMTRVKVVTWIRGYYMAIDAHVPPNSEGLLPPKKLYMKRRTLPFLGLVISWLQQTTTRRYTGMTQEVVIHGLD